MIRVVAKCHAMEINSEDFNQTDVNHLLTHVLDDVEFGCLQLSNYRVLGRLKKRPGNLEGKVVKCFARLEQIGEI